jgi:hypothetical protein
MYVNIFTILFLCFNLFDILRVAQRVRSFLVCYVLPLKMSNKFEFEFEFLCLTPISAIFQLYHGDKF